MKPDIDPTLTMAPLLALSMCLPNSRQHQKEPLRLTSMTVSQSSSVTVSAGVSLRAIPALLTRMSTLPWRATRSLATSATRLVSVTSMIAVSASKPFAFRLAFALSATLLSRSPMTTLAPASASASAQASPMPCPPPVMNAVLPFSLNFSRYMLLFPILAASCRLLSAPDGVAACVEAMDARGLRYQRHMITGVQAQLTDVARRQHAERAGIDIEEGVAAEVLGHRDRSLPAAGTVALDLEMLRPYADRGRALLQGVLAGHEVHLGRTDEAGDEEVGRLLVEIQRRAVLLDLAAVEHDDLVGHGHGLDLVVGDIDRRGAELLLEPCHLDAHLHTQRRVEIGEWLVEQKRLGLADDGAPDRDALALAAGELARLAIEIGREVQRCGGGLDLTVDLVLGQPRHLQAEADVAAHAHMRIERIGLEHHREPALGRRRVDHVLAVDQDLAAGDVLESRDQPQERGLAAARWPHEHHERPIGDLQVRALDDVHGAEGFLHVLKCDLTHDPAALPTLPRQR